jgi:hypothetical protein
LKRPFRPAAQIRLPDSKLTLRSGTSSTSESYVEDPSLHTIWASPFQSACNSPPPTRTSLRLILIIRLNSEGWSDMCEEAPVSPAQVEGEALPRISLERRHVSNSSSSVSEVLVDVSSSNSDLASLAPYALPVFLLDFFGLTGGLGSFGGDGFFFLRFFSTSYSLRSFRAFTSFEQSRM